MLTINLSRKKGTINIPAERPAQLPENLATNISNLTVPSLKQICDVWNIQRRGLTRMADIQDALRNGFISNTNKKDKGQYNTTNATYIFDGFVPLEKHRRVVDPCAGDGDLIAYICQFGDAEKIMFDIDPSKVCCQTRNTLTEPVDYTDMMLVMNPPYLSNVQNKDTDNTTIYEKYGLDDLYKCYIQTMCATPPPEFMIIIPLNFLCSVRAADRKLREQFFTTFEVMRINIFNEQVFTDTSYSVCAIHGIKNRGVCLLSMPAHIYPSSEKIQLDFSPNFLIGGEIYDLPESKTHTVGRALTGSKNVSNLFLKAIDDSQLINLCVAQHPADGSFGKVSDRSYAWLIVEPTIDENKQKYVADKFNHLISGWRKKYHSLFLTNYRENGRKRISFGLAFRIVSYILSLNEVDDIQQYKNMNFLMLVETTMTTHKDERGILVWKNLSESTDTQINLVATYEAYDTGITYEMVFDDGNIATLHKLFAFDASIIFDIIKLVPMLSVDDKCVVAKYYTEVAQRKCDIVITLPRKECEGENEITRQNKILLRQVATMADRISALETQINKLALCVMNCSYNESVGNLLYLCDIIGANNITIGKTPLLETLNGIKNDYSSGNLLDNTAKSVLQHISTDINVLCLNGQPIIICIIDHNYYHIDNITENFLFINEHKKIDILLQSKTGETALSVCRKKIIESHKDGVRLAKWKKLRCIIIAMEKEQQKIPRDVDDNIAYDSD